MPNILIDSIDYKTGDDIVFLYSYDHPKVEIGQAGKIVTSVRVYDPTNLVQVEINGQIFKCYSYRIEKAGNRKDRSNHRLTSIFK